MMVSFDDSKTVHNVIPHYSLTAENMQTERELMLTDIAEAIKAGDIRNLAVVLSHVPINLDLHGQLVRAIIDGPPPGVTDDAATERLEMIRALQASAWLGMTIDEEAAGAVVDAMQVLSAWVTEPPEDRAARLALEDAINYASRLRDMHGDDDPRTMAAMIKVIEMQTPGACGRMLAECGIELPEPTRCDENGRPIYSLEELSEALGVDPDELAETAHELEDLGLGVLRVGEGHTLQ